MGTTVAQAIEVVAMVGGVGGAWVAFKTAGSQARKQRQEGGESYVRASDGAVTTMQRINDELLEDRNYWRERARDCEASLNHALAHIRDLERPAS